MASSKIKYAAIIISSLIAGGLISVTAWQFVNSAQKTEKTENTEKERKVLFWYDPMKPDTDAGAESGIENTKSLAWNAELFPDNPGQRQL